MPRLSSTTPSATISVAVTSVASGSGLARFITVKNGRTRETSSPTSNPPYIARPPIVGVGTGWTFRSFGTSTPPTRTTARRTSGVSRNVVADAATKTIR